MAYFSDISNSIYSAKNIAQQNSRAGNDVHNPFAMMITQNAFPMGLSIFQAVKSNNNTSHSSETNFDVGSLDNDTKLMTTFNKLKDEFINSSEDNKQAAFNKFRDFCKNSKNSNIKSYYTQLIGLNTYKKYLNS